MPGLSIDVRTSALVLALLAGCGGGEPVIEPAAERAPAPRPAPGPVRSDPELETAPAAESRIRFEMAGTESGFDFSRYDDIRGARRILEVNGGGVGLFDYDRDGWLDVFMTNGSRLPRRLDTGETPSALFRNHGHGRFEAVTAEAAIVQAGYNHGCTVGDVDGDGFDDLYVTAYGHDALWLNAGDGTFTDVAESFGADDPRWSSSAAFADFDRDGHLDLYVVNYLEESDENPRVCPNSASPDGVAQCSPAVYEGQSDVLLLSDGAGRFVDASERAGLNAVRGKGLGVVVSDLDRDGDLEIYVANDGEPNVLYPGVAATLAAGGPLEDHAPAAGVALNEHGLAQAGMGIASGDHDGDGTFDLFLTHFFGDTNTLYVNRGGLLFEDATRASGLGPPSRGFLGFGTEFLDADNDGDLDLLVVNGHVDDRSEFVSPEPYRMRPQFFENVGGGRFADVSGSSGEYFRREWLGRGLAIGDLDRDGRVDAVVSQQLAPSQLLWNRTPAGNGAVLRLVGTRSNRNAIGAVVEVLGEGRVVRELRGGGSYQSASALEVHLGIGRRERADVRIVWPSGRGDVISVEEGRCLVVVEGNEAMAGMFRILSDID